MKTFSNISKRTLSMVLAIVMVLSMIPVLTVSSAAETTPAPASSKDRTDNGNGTYTLGLDVTGSTSTETTVSKVNVVLVLDTSNSMTYETTSKTYTDTYTAYGSSATIETDNAYAKVGSEYVKLTVKSSTTYTYKSGWSTKTYTGTLYSRSSSGGKGKGGNNNYTYTALSSDSGSGTVYGKVGSTYTALTRTVTYTYTYDNDGTTVTYTGTVYKRSYSSSSSTRMKDMQAAAKSLVTSLCELNTSDASDTVQIALVSFNATASIVQVGGANYSTDATKINSTIDGLSNSQGTNWQSALIKANDVSFGDSDPVFVIFLTDGDPTQTNSSSSLTDNDTAYKAAKDPAYNVVNGGKTLYAIYAYGSNTSYLTKLVNYAYSGKSYETPSGSQTDYADDYFYNASDSEALAAAFEDIMKSIKNLGFGNAKITDGTTSSVTQTSGEISNLLDVDTTSFKYYRVTGSTKTEWTNAPAATFVDSKVVWDLSSVGQLENGVTYRVEFTVTPSQEAYDIMAGIQNGGDTYYNSLDENIKKYISKDGVLETNTVCTVDYKYINGSTETDGTSTVTNPTDNQVTLTSYELQLEKSFANSLDSKGASDVTINVLADGQLFAEGIALTSANNYKNSVSIAPGIITLNNGVARVYATGHDYTLAEVNGWNWELESETVHPMLINSSSAMTQLILLSEDSVNALGTTAKSVLDTNNYFKSSTAEYYKIGTSYYIAESGEAVLSAVNHRRSNLNITKSVTDEFAPSDALFTYEITVTSPDASDIWFSVSESITDYTLVDNLVVSSNAIAELDNSTPTGYYYFKSGETITVKMKSGWNLRMTNLLAGTTYSVTETAMPAGFEYVSAETTLGTGISDQKKDTTATETAASKKISGTVNEFDRLYIVTIVNQLSDKTKVTINKLWDDADNQDGYRPEEVLFNLYSDGTEILKDISLTSTNSWTATVENLPVYNAAGNKIVYTVKEKNVDSHYTDSYAAADTATAGEVKFAVTNTHTTETVDVNIEIRWNDNENQDSKRPDSVTVNIYADGSDTPVKTVTVTSGESWKKTVEKLPKYNDGKIIDYSVAENDPTPYTIESIEEPDTNKFVITNAYTPGKISVNVTKVWNDANNQDGKRKDVTVKLFADGEDAHKSVTLTAANNYTATFTGLDEYKSGTKIVYTIEEVTVAGYTSVITGDAATGFTITNTHTPEKIAEISVTKVWSDANNQDGKRTEVTVKLLANGAETGKTVTLTEANNYTDKFENLDKYANGKEITYTVKEVTVAGYTSVITGSVAAGFTITNTHTPETIKEISVTKVWNDANNQDGKRTAVTVKLFANGVDTKKTVTLNAANNYTAKFENLDKYANGKEITYTVKEVDIDGYTSVITGTVATGFTITNTHTPETVDVDIEIKWNDNDDQDSKRPDEVTVKIYADGGDTPVKTVTIKSGDDWKKTVEDLPKYKDGKLIDYTVAEDDPTPYTIESTEEPETNKFVITNGYTPGKISVSVTKVWNDADNQDGKRKDVTVKLFADGVDTGKTITLTSTNNYKASFTGLDEYNEGTKIAYTIEEVAIDGYTSKITGSVAEGFTLTNTHVTETVDLDIEVKWEDNDDQDGKRPDEVVVKIYEEGSDTPVKEITVKEGEDWKKTVEDLPKYKDGEEITYTAKEDKVTDYDDPTYKTEDKKIVITNKRDSETIDLDIEVEWDDKDNQDGKRPDEVVIEIFEDGSDTPVKKITIKDDDDWKKTVEDLPKYKDGEEIKYVIKQEKQDDYDDPTYETDDKKNTVSNKHTPETIELSLEKVWVDASNQDGKRPTEITVYIYADGVNVKTVTLKATDDWKTTVSGLDKYKPAGVEIVYTIKEKAVDGYSSAVEGTVITNTHTPGTKNITFTKVWDDNDDEEGVRDKYGITLYADGVAVGNEVILEADVLTYTWNNLPEYADGKKIVYTVKETTVPDFYLDPTETPATVDEDGTVTITNTIDLNSELPDPPPLTGLVKLTMKKVWLDLDASIKHDPVTVVIYRNGSKFYTATLSDDNNWTFEWSSNADYTWTVEETNCPAGYTVSYEIVANATRKNISVTVTNKVNNYNNPSTGDNFGYIAAAAVAAAAGIVAIPVIKRRKKEDEDI